MATFLSRMTLDLRSREARRDLADCYEMHRTVMSLFGAKAADPGPTEPRAPYRVEAEGERAMAPLVLIQSGEAPDWSRLPGGYPAASGHPNPETKRIDPLLRDLDRLPALQFLLVANPTRKVHAAGANGTGLKPARVEIRDDAALVEWLRRKAELGGFELLQVRSARSAGVYDVRARTGKRYGRQSREGRANSLTFGAVRFDGRLRVTDAGAFERTVATGIGSGKAFGFGLLSVAPAR